ncbi:MAG: alpha/beta hydrolase [Magnetococcales bacterium]|nr:alpha/beta hydrolase [Magnetococcales bacterium]
MAIWLASLLGAYGAICLGMYLFQEKLLFHPDRILDVTPADWQLPYEEVWMGTGKRRIHAWWLAGRDPQSPVILFCHGNTGNIGSLAAHAALFREVGAPVLFFDYRGYGKSPGRPTEQNLYDDVLTAWDYLRQARGVAPERIVLYGFSLGGGPATWLADRQAPAGLVLESAFSSLVDVAQEHYPWLPVGRLTRYRFDNVSRLKEIQAPTLIVHCRDDRVVPPVHGQRLHDAAAGPKTLFWTRGDHNRCLTWDPVSGAAELRRFFARAGFRN